MSTFSHDAVRIMGSHGQSLTALCIANTENWLAPLRVRKSHEIVPIKKINSLCSYCMLWLLVHVHVLSIIWLIICSCQFPAPPLRPGYRGWGWLGLMPGLNFKNVKTPRLTLGQFHWLSPALGRSNCPAIRGYPGSGVGQGFNWQRHYHQPEI